MSVVETVEQQLFQIISGKLFESHFFFYRCHVKKKQKVLCYVIMPLQVSTSRSSKIQL